MPWLVVRQCAWIDCEVRACKELVSNRHVSLGHYCARHAETAWRFQRIREDEEDQQAQAEFDKRTREIRRDVLGMS